MKTETGKGFCVAGSHIKRALMHAACSVRTVWLVAKTWPKNRSRRFRTGTSHLPAAYIARGSKNNEIETEGGRSRERGKKKKKERSGKPPSRSLELKGAKLLASLSLSFLFSELKNRSFSNTIYSACNYTEGKVVCLLVYLCL